MRKDDDIPDHDDNILNGDDDHQAEVAESDDDNSEQPPQSDAGPYEGQDYPLCRNQSKQNVQHWEAAMNAAAERNGGTVPMRWSVMEEDRMVCLPDVARTSAPADTETLLNGLIEDCRYLIKEVIFQSARLTPNPHDRQGFLAAAGNLAATGAKVGRTIADLRGARTPAAEENRYRMIVEHVQSAPVLKSAAVVAPVRKGRGRGKTP